MFLTTHVNAYYIISVVLDLWQGKSKNFFHGSIILIPLQFLKSLFLSVKNILKSVLRTYVFVTSCIFHIISISLPYVELCYYLFNPSFLKSCPCLFYAYFQPQKRHCPDDYEEVEEEQGNQNINVFKTAAEQLVSKGQVY